MKRLPSLATLALIFAVLAAQALPATPANAGDFDLPPVTYPQNNGYSPDKANLGKMLFFDPRLSGSNVISCATCHNPSLGWADGLPLGVGHGSKLLGRSSPSVVNSVYYDKQFWDGRAPSLEEQAKGPIASTAEMNQNPDELVAELKAISGYQREFERVFPGEGITYDTIARAIATYERGIVSNSSPFDAYMNGDQAAISQQAKNGWTLFKGKARCLSCHSGANFSDNRFHNIGVNDNDLGRIAVTDKKRDNRAFKTPTLRDVTRTAPYMHNGSEATLTEVIRFYNRGGDKTPNRLSPLKLSESEIADLVAFMVALTGPQITETLPQLP